MRWNRPGLGVVPADVFVALAENLGLITDLGTWVLATAAAQCCTWQQDGQCPIRVSINASSYQFRRLDMIAVVSDALRQSGLNPDRLVLEITESQVMLDMEQNLQSLKQLRRMGIHIALDDFGTGYSSLSYLQQLPIDMLKIDQSFVAGMLKSDDSHKIVTTIIALARNLGMKTVAEGVEEPGQAERLRALGCDTAQGYFFARPMTAKEAEQFVENGLCCTLPKGGVEQRVDARSVERAS